MWSDESKMTQFQSDGCVRGRRQTHEVMHISCIWPSVEASKGSVMIWGIFSWLGLGAETVLGNKIAVKFVSCNLNLLNYQIIRSMDFSSLMTQTYSRTQILKKGFMSMSNFIFTYDWLPHCVL